MTVFSPGLDEHRAKQLLHPIVSDPRRAGNVRRYHTWPWVGEAQTVAAHSWNVARILLAIWPDAPKTVLVRALYHDLGEMAAGDPPWPVKASDPTIKGALDAIEAEAVDAMRPFGVVEGGLDTHERAVVKLAEMVEMWEAGLEQVALGNLAGLLVANRCWREIEERAKAMPAPVQVRLSAYVGQRRKTERVVESGE